MAAAGAMLDVLAMINCMHFHKHMNPVYFPYTFMYYALGSYGGFSLKTRL